MDSKRNKTVLGTIGSPDDPPTSLSPAEKQSDEPLFFFKDAQEKVFGPFSQIELQRLVKQNKLLPSFHLSSDRKKWLVATKMPGLFANLEEALSADLGTNARSRSLSRKEQVSLFIDQFVLNNENLKDSVPWLQELRILWARLTLPSDGFIITEVTASGVRHVRHNFNTGESEEIGEKELDQKVSDGIKRLDWFKMVGALLAIVWLIWSFKDFVFGFSFTMGTFKTILVGAIAFVSFIYKTKNSKVFVGYILDPKAEQKLGEIKNAFMALRQSSRVWMYEVKATKDQMHWKYNAGGFFTVEKLPAVIFNRPIPNVETNVKVIGITFQNQAIYFLPERILVIEDGEIEHVAYEDLQIATDVLEYVEPKGRVYPDSEIIDHRWKYINKDGSRDKRFKSNYKLPVIRCGILKLRIDSISVELMTTNPKVPGRAKALFDKIRSRQ